MEKQTFKYKECYIYVTESEIGVEATPVDIMALISSLIQGLIDQGVSKELLEKAVDVGLNGKDEMEKQLNEMLDKLNEMLDKLKELLED